VGGAWALRLFRSALDRLDRTEADRLGAANSGAGLGGRGCRAALEHLLGHRLAARLLRCTASVGRLVGGSIALPPDPLLGRLFGGPLTFAGFAAHAGLVAPAFLKRAGALVLETGEGVAVGG
jgi:hypothetical protein